MTRKLNLLLLLALVFAGVPFGWFMLDTATAPHGAMPVTIAQLRTLAASLRGSAPQEVQYETIGRRRLVGDLIAAGSGLRPVVFAIRAYKLTWPDGQVITIDRGMPRALAQSQRLSDFDPVAQAHVEQAVASASTKLLLSYEPQHSGSAKRPFGGRIPPSSAPDTSADVPYAVAPGVVVIPANGVRPGERMIYVRLGDGNELLFAGDIAPANVSWSEQRPPARFVTTFFVPGNREQIAAWLRTIQSLKKEAPSLQIVAGHDSALPRVLKHGFNDHRHRLSSVTNDKRLARHPAMR